MLISLLFRWCYIKIITPNTDSSEYRGQCGHWLRRIDRAIRYLYINTAYSKSNPQCIIQGFIRRLSQRRAWTEYFREFLSIIALWECCKYVLWDTSLKNNSSESDVNIEMLELPTLVHILALGSRSDRFIPRACKKTDSWYPLLAFISNTACLFYKYIKHRVSILQIYQTPRVYPKKEHQLHYVYQYCDWLLLQLSHYCVRDYWRNSTYWGVVDTIVRNRRILDVQIILGICQTIWH